MDKTTYHVCKLYIVVQIKTFSVSVNLCSLYITKLNITRVRNDCLLLDLMIVLIRILDATTDWFCVCVYCNSCATEGIRLV